MDFAEVLREHWPRYVEGAAGPIPSRAWSAVEAVFSCRTERRGGHVHHCPACRAPALFSTRQPRSGTWPKRLPATL